MSLSRVALHPFLVVKRHVAVRALEHLLLLAAVFAFFAKEAHQGCN
jgi:hypothetical protein